MSQEAEWDILHGHMQHSGLGLGRSPTAHTLSSCLNAAEKGLHAARTAMKDESHLAKHWRCIYQFSPAISTAHPPLHASPPGQPRLQAHANPALPAHPSSLSPLHESQNKVHGNSPPIQRGSVYFSTQYLPSPKHGRRLGVEFQS